MGPNFSALRVGLMGRVAVKTETVIKEIQEY